MTKMAKSQPKMRFVLTAEFAVKVFLLIHFKTRVASLISRLHNSIKKQPVGFTLWVIFFCYSCCAALIFQNILLPILSPETAGTGLLPNDSAYFHEVATKLAAEIREFGWGRWSLFPSTGAAGNVAVLALVYAIFGNDPALIIPINAAIHALGGFLIFQITREVSGERQGNAGLYAGVIAATLFVMFPSALNWYGQLHKDGYAIAGILLIFLGLVRIFGKQITKTSMSLNGLVVSAGILLVGVVRPYNLKLIFVLIVVLLVIVILTSICLRKLRLNLKVMIFLFFTLVVISLASSVLGNRENAQVGDTYAKWISSKEWEWKKSDWLTLKLDQQIEVAARTRVGLIDYGAHEKAGSMIDVDRTPQNASEALIYLPRALQVAAFAPFPDTWLNTFSPTRLVAAAEMLAYYICLPGILLLLLYNRSSPVLLAIYFASFFLTIHGFTIANIGTLYRLRYAYLFILVSLGVLGWVTWIYKSGKFNRCISFFKAQIENSPASNESLTSSQNHSRKETMSSSAIVMLLTMACFIGFFVRDITMANTYGLGGSLDYFFIALMFPMFLVTIFAMPLGSAFVPFYLDIKQEFTSVEVGKAVRGTASLITMGLSIVCIVLYLIGPVIYGYFYGQETLRNSQLLYQLSTTALPLLLLSGVMILGNSILNANGETVFTSMTQLVVPIAAVLALLMFGRSFGIVAVLYGMVVGQILNLAIVQLRLRYYSTSIMPEIRVPKIPQQSSLHKQYWPLVGSAIFIGVATPIAILLAAQLSEGAVSIFNLGSKVVLFVTGLLGAVITTVMLPYFSHLMAKNNLIGARRELSFFLLIATFVAVPLSIAIFVSSELIVDLLLAGGGFSDDAKLQMVRVMQYSVVQLPFFVCNALLLRFAVSTKHVFAILAIAILGLIANILISVVLMKQMGVAGIALGGSVSVLLSTVMLSLVLVRYWHITLLDLIVILLNWLLFITLLIAIHFQNLPSVYIVVMAYFVLMFGYFRSLISTRFLR